MHPARSIATLVAILAAAGCADHLQRSPVSPDLRPSVVRTRIGPVPIDPAFRLTAEQRREIRPTFDPDALETFLAALPVERRADTFDLFRRRQPGERVPMLTDIGGPLQELLEEVWAPHWLALPQELRERAPTGNELPGRAAALRRLRAGQPTRR